MLVRNLYIFLIGVIILSSCEERKIVYKDRIVYKDSIEYRDTGSVRIEYQIIYKDTCIDKPPIEVIKWKTVYQDTGSTDTIYYYEMLAIDTSLTSGQSRGVVIAKYKGESDYYFITDSGVYGYYKKLYDWMEAVKFHLDYVDSLKIKEN